MSTVLAILGGSMPATGQAQAAEVAKPEYQVKLRLAPQAIDELGEPSRAFRNAFTVEAGSSREQSVYFDTQDKLYSGYGWSIRLRLKDDADSYDVTFKRRIPMGDNSLSKDSIQAALEESRRQNLDASDTNYDAQVNASYKTSTIDFSNKKSADCVTVDCPMPSRDEALDLIQQLEPGKLSKGTGTTLEATKPLMSAVVQQQTWRVNIAGINTDLEVSSFAGQHWIEISEEESSRSDAVEKREKLISALEAEGFLMHDDAFKTSSVLETLGGRA